MKKVVFILLVLIILVGVVKLNMREGFVSKDELLKEFDDNYSVFLSIGERLKNKDGYYYAQFVNGEIVFDTSDEELLQDVKLRKDIEFIMIKLKFMAVCKDKDKQIVYFDRVHYSGSQGIVYSTLSEPKVFDPEVIRDSWYYYLDNMNGL